MMEFMRRLRSKALRWTDKFHKAEHLSHVGYFGAIVLSGHDPYVVVFALICLLIIVVLLVLGEV